MTEPERPNHRAAVLSISSMLRSALVAAAFFSLLHPAGHCEETACSGKEAFQTDAWKGARPAHLPVEIMAANASGWIGINHVYMTREYAVRSASLFLPWANPRYVQSFRFAHAIEEIDNKRPIFYLHLSDILAGTYDISALSIRLARLTNTGDERTLQVTSGRFAWTARRTIPASRNVTVTVTRLSDNFAQISIDKDLANGEYLLLMNEAGGDGFEFRIGCN